MWIDRYAGIKILQRQFELIATIVDTSTIKARRQQIRFKFNGFIQIGQGFINAPKMTVCLCTIGEYGRTVRSQFER